MDRIAALHNLGQSLWLDDLHRGMIESGELERRIADGDLRGMTSNPTIFEQAIAGSQTYTADLRQMSQSGWSAARVLDNLILDDIRAAADLFRPLYESSGAGDGFVSLEVHPTLADDTESTLVEVRRLWAALNRPNVMIKIPATAAGVPAVRRAIAEGINVNITLIFSLTRYAEVIEAYLSGLEERLQRGAALDHVASVASFFVSRVDSAVDARLDQVIREERPEAERAAALRGQAAIANAKLAYAQFQGAFSATRFERLRSHGARPQRPLWASTSTKNPAYPDTYYVDSLIGPDTVDTLPTQTLEAFRDHGTPALTLEEGLSTARSRLEALESLGISMAAVTMELERQGVAKFAASFSNLLKTLEQRTAAARREIRAIQPRLSENLQAIEEGEVGRRLWSRDGSLWPGEPSQWLGWLDLPADGLDQLGTFDAFARQAAEADFAKAVLLGMGGSSLAASVLAGYGAGQERLDLQVLDTVEPGAVLKAGRPASKKSLVLVASKSGTTVEPLSLFAVFWEKARGRGESFVAITDPGTPLESLASERGFRRTFGGPPDVGGRYAALSAFGLAPAALAGVDLRGLLQGGAAMARQCGPNIDAARNPGLFLGALLAAAAQDGRDKITLFADASHEPFLGWVEQLLAESSGKSGKGFFPVVGEPPASAGRYDSDRLIVYLRSDGSLDARVESWVEAGIPVATVSMRPGAAGLGAEFFRWETATAVACHRLGLNAFDQPDVQRAKDAARKALRGIPEPGDDRKRRRPWRMEGPGEDHTLSRDLSQAMSSVLSRLQPGDAFVLLAYLPQTKAAERDLGRVRRQVRDQLRNATLVGFGPRYLHSTGQLFKGGPDRMVVLVVRAPSALDVPIPGEGHTLGGLMQAQALGDYEAMKAIGRRVFLLTLDSPRRLSEIARAAGPAAKRAARLLRPMARES